MNLAAHIAAEEAHTAKLAAIPGWREYIKDKADVYARKQPALYRRLPDIVSATPINATNQETAHAL